MKKFITSSLFLIIVVLMVLKVEFSWAAFIGSAKISNNNFSTGIWSLPGAPVLVNPTDDLLTNVPLFFEWTNSIGNYFPPLTANLEIYNVDPAIFPLTVPYISQSNIGQTRYPAENVISFPDGYYFWRVKNIDSRGSQSSWSETRKFKIDASPPVTAISVENSPRRTMNEQITDGTFEKYENLNSLIPDFSTTGQVDLINNEDNTFEGQKMILLGQKNTDSDFGQDINTNRISYIFNNNSKTISFYYNFFSSDEYPFDSPGFIFKINNEQILNTDTFESSPSSEIKNTGWKQFMYDISSFDGSTMIDFLAGNTDDLYLQSWVYIDKVSTGLTAVNSKAKFFLEATDNFTDVSAIKKYYCIDDCIGDNTNWILYSGSYSLDLPNGEHNLYFYSEDVLGNKEIPQVKFIYFDNNSPQKISDLRIKNLGDNFASLVFTAVSQDNEVSSGKVSGYNAKISEEYVDSASNSAVLNDWWGRAVNINYNIISEEPTVLQEFNVLNLLADKNYYLGIKSFDAAENFSEISNIVNVYISPSPTPTPTPTITPSPTLTPTPSTPPIPTSTEIPTPTPTF